LLTFVDHLELANEVEPDLAEVVLEQLEEQGQELLNGSIGAQERGQAGDLHSDSSPDVLARVGGQILDAGEDSSENDVSVDELREAWM
jgi:hypothetical protein